MDDDSLSLKQQPPDGSGALERNRNASFSFTSLHREQHAQEERYEEEEGESRAQAKLLHSTPNAKGRPHVAHRRVHRNSGSGNISGSGSSSRRLSFEPVSSSNTETETSEAESGSESETDIRQGDEGPDFNGQQPRQGDTARKPYPVREYWNNLILDVEGGSASRGVEGLMADAQERSKSSAREGPLSTRDSARLSGLLLRPGHGASTNTPSIGSSTLVDQESLQGGHHVAGEAKAPVAVASSSPSLRDHYAQLEDRYERPVSAPPTSTPARAHSSEHPRRTSPLQNHMARFAPSSSFASSAYLDAAEASRESRPLDSSGSVHDGEQERSRGSHVGGAGGDPSFSTTTPQPSLAASRIHDIFARHIHNASASLAASSRSNLARSIDNVSSAAAEPSRVASSASFGRGGSIVNGVKPRHRLRDLLASTAEHECDDLSLSMSARHIAKLPSRSPQRNRREDSHISPESRRSEGHSSARLPASGAPSPSSSRRSTPLKNASRTMHPIHASPSPSRKSSHYASPSRPHQQRSTSPLHIRPSAEHSQEDILSSSTPAANRLSREWQDVVARNAALTATARAAGQLVEQHGSESDAGLETDSSDEGEGDDVSESGQQDGMAEGKQEEFDSGDGSFSPDLRDYDEEEQLTDIQEPDDVAYGAGCEKADEEQYDSLTQQEGVDSAAEESANPSHVFLHERRSSPGKTSLRRFRALQTDLRSEASLTPARVSTPPSRRATPPKTPHLPGFYHSSTPYHATPAPASRARQLSHLEASSSQTPAPAQPRTAGDPSFSLSVYVAQTPAPRLPGAYSSPFPHPQRAGEVVGPAASETARLQAVRQQEEWSTLQASTRLEQITEGDETTTEPLELSASPAPVKRSSPSSNSTTPKGTPTRSRRSPLGSSHASTQQLPPSPSSRRVSGPLQRIEGLQDQPVGVASAASPSPVTSVTPQSSSAKRSSGESPESVMHSLLSELVKPLGYLLGNSVSSAGTGAIGAGPVGTEDDVAAVLAPTKIAYRDALAEKGSRKLEQDAILQRLAEAERLDQSLASRIDEIRREVNEIGSRLTSQVGTVLSEAFALESRRRRWWLALALLLEIAIVWAIFTFASTRANLAYQTTYFDPFFPALYADGETAYRVSSALRYSSLSSSAFSSAPSACSGPLSTFFDATRFTTSVSLPVTLSHWPTWLCIYALAAKESLASIWLRLLSPIDFVHGTHLTQSSGADMLSASGSLVRAAGYRIPT